MGSQNGELLRISDLFRGEIENEVGQDQDQSHGEMKLDGEKSASANRKFIVGLGWWMILIENGKPNRN